MSYFPTVGSFLGDDLEGGDMTLYRFAGGQNNGPNSDFGAKRGVRRTVALCRRAGWERFVVDGDAWVAQQNQQAAAQQQQISDLQDYAYKLGTAQSTASTAFQQANAAAASAWFPSSVAAAGDQAIQAQKAGIQLDTQIEQFRQSLLANPQYAGAVLPNSDVYSTLSSQSSFNQTLVGNATYWNNLINEPGLQSTWSPLDLVAGVAAGIITAPAAMTTSTASSSLSTPTALESTTSIIGGEAPSVGGAGILGLDTVPTGPISSGLESLYLQRASSSVFQAKLWASNQLARVVGGETISATEITEALANTEFREAGLLSSSVRQSGSGFLVGGSTNGGYFASEVADHELLHIAQYLRNPGISTGFPMGIVHEVVPAFVGSPGIYIGGTTVVGAGAYGVGTGVSKLLGK